MILLKIRTVMETSTLTIVQVKQVLREIQVLPDQLVHRVTLVLQATMELTETTELTAKQVLKETLVLQATMELTETTVLTVLMAKLVHKEILVVRV